MPQVILGAGIIAGVKVSPRMRASLWGFLYSSSGVLVFLVFVTGPGIAQASGVMASVLINGLLLVAGGLIGAGFVWFRRNPPAQRWSWSVRGSQVEVRSPAARGLLVVSPDELSWRQGGRTESLAWEQIDSVEIVVGRDVLGPHRGALRREALGMLVPVESHESVSVRLMPKGQAFLKAWVLSDARQSVAQGDIDRLRSLMAVLHGPGSRDDRERRLQEFASVVSPAG